MTELTKRLLRTVKRNPLYGFSLVLDSQTYQRVKSKIK